MYILASYLIGAAKFIDFAVPNLSEWPLRSRKSSLKSWKVLEISDFKQKGYLLKKNIDLWTWKLPGLLFSILKRLRKILILKIYGWIKYVTFCTQPSSFYLITKER